MDSVVGTILAVFFITFGFLGLEFISIFLDDPFGKDPIDFDLLSMTEVRMFATLLFTYIFIV